MPNLHVYKKEIKSIFQLLGEKENDISYSVGWALAKSSNLMKQFLINTVGIENYDFNDINIKLQRYEKEKGFTDFEIELPGCFYLIIEAKRGWNLPTQEQLQKYITRTNFISSNAKIKKMLVLTECSKDYAETHFKCDKLEKIEVVHISWKDIYNYSLKAIKTGSHAEKRLLNELKNYLEDIMTTQNKNSNWVYVVSLGSGNAPNSNISWIDIVNKKSRYFHPIGGGKGGWPYEPPNYIAFRYKGKLQSIHHIQKYEVFTDPHKVISEIPSSNWEPHYLYHLDKGFAPSNAVKTGADWRAIRVWVMLDTLFTCKTISEARDISQQR